MQQASTIAASDRATISWEIRSVQPALRRRLRRPSQRRSRSRRRRWRGGGGGGEFWDEASSSHPTCWKKLGAVLLLDIYMKVCVCVYMRRSSMAATHQPAVLHCLLRSLGALSGRQHAWTCQCKKHIGLAFFVCRLPKGTMGRFPRMVWTREGFLGISWRSSSSSKYPLVVCWYIVSLTLCS